MDIGSVCPSCAFENPKAWRACAACGRPLGSGFRPTSVTGLGGAERTVVTSSALDDEPRTLESLGNELGLSKERVRQLESAAFGKMREWMEREATAAVDFLH